MNEKLKGIKEIFTKDRLNIGLQFLFFVLISSVFWIIVTFNNQTHLLIEVKVEVTNKPDSITLIQDLPPYIEVVVKDKGKNLVPKLFAVPKLNLSFKDFADKKSHEFRITNAQLRSRISQLFDKAAEIQSISIDQLSVSYTGYPGKKVPLHLNFEIVPDISCEVNGPIETDVDSVLIYGSKESLDMITAVATSLYSIKNIKDTVRRELPITPITGVRIEPSYVKVMIPVESLIRKTMVVPIEVLNEPENTTLVTFPSTVKISYLVPKSMFKHKNTIKAGVDYKDLIQYPNESKLEVRLGESPALYKNVSFDVDSVEYLIEFQQDV